MPSGTQVPKKPSNCRGFAAMDPERRKQISSKGGASVPAHKRSFATNRELAASAGALGGKSSHGGGRRLNTPKPEEF